MFAALNIYKPKGITSHDVIARLRRIYGLKKIGHLGTLDPLAEGVLPVCLGQATRLIEYFPDDKRYTAEVTVGQTTTTLDGEGETVSVTDCTGMDLSEATLNRVLQQFTGTIVQQVPLYSAVHVGGKKLYELARQGKTADLPSRETTIHELKLISCNQENPAHPVLKLEVHCSSGTYIRSLARDIGEALGGGAYMSSLLRTAHGRFQVEDSVPLVDLKENPDPGQFLQNPTSFLTLPVLNLASEEEARLLTNGMKILPALADSDLIHSPTGKAVQLKPNAFYLALYQDRPLGVVQLVSHKLKPIKIFHWEPAIG